MKKNKKQHIVVYFLKMLLIFIALDLVMMIFAGLITNSSLGYKYGSDLIMELFYGLFVLIVMLLFKNSYVFTSKQEKFWVGVKLAIPMLVVAGINLIGSISSLDSFSFLKFINVLVLSLFVGIAEEFLCRGWLQNEFIERYSDNKNSVIISIILSSLVFGFMHILNIGAQTAFETLLQIVNAVSLGLLLGSIYYKTKNIWSVIFLHSIYDFAIFLGEMNLVKDCTYNTPTFGVALVNGVGIIAISAVWVLTAILVLRKTDFPRKKASKRIDNSSIKILIIIAFVVVFLPLDLFVPEYKDYKVCYDYKTISPLKNYTSHFPSYERYYISGTKDEDIKEDYSIEFTISGGRIHVKNLVTNLNITLGIKDVIKMEVLENQDNYIIVAQTYENETTIYYSDYLNKNEIVNEDFYLDGLKKSFKKFELPEIGTVGYVTIDDSETKHPAFISVNSDYFIIKNGELYLIKK